MKERRAKQMVFSAELEDNCGALISRRKKVIPIKYREGSRLADASGNALIQQEFDRFVRSIPDELEV